MAETYVVPANKAKVGDTVFCGLLCAVVLEIKRYAPGEHPNSPIRNEFVGVELITDNGSRWFGERQ